MFGATIFVAENTTAVGADGFFVATAGGTAVTYTLGGTDAGSFGISTDGTLTFTEAPDFEMPRGMAFDADSNTTNYALTVSAMNSAGSTPSGDITVRVYDDNDAPTDAAITTAGDVTTVTNPATLVLSATATDPDIGDPLTYTWSSSATGDSFSDGGIGDSVTWTPPTVMAATTVTLTVTVTDGDTTPLTTTATQMVTVNPVADTAPAFSVASLNAQTFTVGTAITAITLPVATGGNGAITYTLTPALPAGLTYTAADRTIIGNPTATATATMFTYTAADGDDNTDAGDTATLTFSITVAEEDTAPVFTNAATIPATISVAEGTLDASTTAVGAFGLFVATGTGTVTYALGGTDAALFTLSDSGTLTFNNPPNFEMPRGNPIAADNTNDYPLTVTATAGGETTELSVTVRVTDVGEAPVFGAFTPPTFTEYSPGTHTFTATDDAGDTLTFSLFGATHGNAAITTAGVFTWTPREMDGGVAREFRITVGDDGAPRRSVSRTFAITAMELPNRAPTSATIAGATIATNPNPLMLTATGVDPDTDDTLTFSWTVVTTDGGSFSSTTGAGTTYIPPTIAAGAAARMITIRVTATDAGMATVTDEHIVTVRARATGIALSVVGAADTTPVTSVNEGDTRSLRVLAIPSPAGSAFATTQQFSLSVTPPPSSRPANAADPYVAYTALTGTTTELGTSPTSRAFYSFSMATTEDAFDHVDFPVVFTATPVSGTPATTTLTLRDNDIGIRTSVSTVSVAQSGTASYDVRLGERPPASAVVSVVSGTPGSATVSPATLTFSTGNWNMAQTVTVAGVLAGSATISHTAPASGDFTFVTNDVAVTVTPPAIAAPVFTNAAAFATAIEVAENQDAVGAADFFAASDTPTGNLVLSGADASRFTLSGSGTLTFNDAPNFEMPRGAAFDAGSNTNDYALTVTATNSTGSTPANFTVRVTDVNDVPVLDAFPTVAFTEYSAGTLTITATDEDRPAQDLTFSITGEAHGATLAANGAFSWTPGEDDGGVLRSFTVRVVDNNDPPGAAVASLTITATELANRAPTGAAITTAGGATAVTNPGTLGVSASATDPDTGDMLTYTWSSDATGDSFSSDTGASVTWTPPTVMAATMVTLTVTITDSTDGRVTVTQNVMVNPMPAIAPVFTNAATIPATISVAEGTTAVGTFGLFVATGTGTVTYALGGTDASRFTLSDSGTLTFNNAPDFEMPRGNPIAAGNTNDYPLTVTATAGGLSTERSVTVRVTDVGEAPVFGAFTPPTFTEYSPGTHTFTATDDAGDTLTFSLFGATHGNAAITTAGVFTWTPREMDGGVAREFRITVGDDGAPRRSRSRTFAITADELPNRAPTSATIAGATIATNPNPLMLTATGVDPDTDDTLTFSWTVVTTDGGSFSSTTGAGTTYIPPTIAAGGTARMITIRVTATDAGMATVTDEHIVTVNPADTSPAFASDASIADQTFVANSQQVTLTLPAVETAGDGATTYTLTPAIADLTLSASRVLSGRVRTAAVATQYTYTATDEDGSTDTLTFNITVMADTPPSFGGVTIADQTYLTGETVALTLPAATGGNPPYAYFLSDGMTGDAANLPAGLTFNADATPPTITGIPTTATTAAVDFTYGAADSDLNIDGSDRASLDFSITVLTPATGITLSVVGADPDDTPVTSMLEGQTRALRAIVAPSPAGSAFATNQQVSITATAPPSSRPANAAAPYVAYTALSGSTIGIGTTPTSRAIYSFSMATTEDAFDHADFTVTFTATLVSGPTASTTLTLQDNDIGISTSVSSVSVVQSETVTYDVQLGEQPPAAATVTVVSGTPANATVSPATLDFTTANWNTAKTVTVAGVLAGSATISHTAPASGDFSYVTNALAVTVTAPAVTAPAFTNAAAFASAIEVAENQDAVGGEDFFGASDTPTGNLVLSGTDASRFTLSGSGTLTFNDAPNFEMPRGAPLTGTNTNDYALTVTATNSAGSTPANFTVRVTDVNDAPTITSPAAGAYTATTFTEYSAGTFNVVAADVDDGQTVSHALTAGADFGASVNATTGAFTWTPREMDGGVAREFTVTVSDSATTPMTATVTFSITAVELDNRAPTGASITLAGGVTSVTNPATLGVSASATDPDTGDMLTYTWSSSATGDTFAPTTGASVTWTPAAVTAATTVTLTVTVSDDATPPLTTTATQDVVVNPVPVAPVFTNSPGAAFVVAEGATAVGAAGFFIATGTGVVALTLGGTDGALFGITAAGTLTFNDAPDFEMPRGMALTAGNTNNYALTVTATASSLTTELLILVRVTNVNEAPVLAAITPGTFTEYTAGTIAITATDVDAATTLSFALTGEAHGATLSGGTFTWTPGEDDGGVARIFSVTVTDDGSPMMSDSATFTITAAELANRAPASVAITLAGGVTAVTNPATLGVSATATDPDTGDTLTYTWSSSATGDSFSSDTGASVTWTPPPVTAVTTVTLTVTVTDSTDGSVTATQMVMVNPVPVAPTFTNSPGAAFMVAEGATAVGGNAGFVATAAGATVTYSLSGADMAFFSIDAGGTLTFNDAPDFEMPRGMAIAAGNTNDYALTVTATASSLTTELSITVSVTNVNEAPVLAAITPGTFIEYTAGTIAIAATDEDGTSTTLSFALTGEAHGATLSGSTFTWTPGEDDGGVARMFSVTVTDDGSPMMSDTATFTITAAELANRAPTSATIAGAATVVSPNTLTLTATGVDPDTGDTLTFSWTVVTTDGGSLAPTTGASVTWTPPAIAAGGTARMITIRLTATDAGGATVTDDHIVTVNPMLAAGTAPTFTNMAMFSTAIEAAENQTAAGAANFFAAPGSGTVDLTLGGTDMALFTLAANGTLTFNTAPNFEMPRNAAFNAASNTNNYALTVTAMNSTGSTPSGAITVRVTDANDAPVLDAFPTVAFEEYSEGTLTITATDEDRPAQDLTFTFVGPDRGATLTAAGAFSWTPGEADGGVVRTFIIQVADDNAPPATDTAPLAITATELPNRAPTGAAITTAGGVTAVTNPATLTVMATATDPDTSDTLTYTWSSDATGDSFSSDTGASVVWTPPTVMAAATVTLTVTVSDDATPPLTTTATQMVTVNSMPVVDTAPAFAAGATIAAQTYTQGTAITPLTLPVATGGNNGITYTLTPALPAGLTHNANPRTITGNPTATLTATMYTWTATDGDANTAADDTATLMFSITITAPDSAPAFADGESIADQTYTQGTAVNLTLPVATGGNDGITYTLTPALPTGLTYTAAGRTITGNPTATLTAQTFTWTAVDGDTNTAADDIATLTFTIMVVEEDIAPAFAASVTIAAQTYTQGTAITPLTLPVATGGNNGITYTLTPALPAGLTHNANPRTITGNPTATLTERRRCTPGRRQTGTRTPRLMTSSR